MAEQLDSVVFLTGVDSDNVAHFEVIRPVSNARPGRETTGVVRGTLRVSDDESLTLRPGYGYGAYQYAEIETPGRPHHMNQFPWIAQSIADALQLRHTV